MTDFDLDLRSVEDRIDEFEDDTEGTEEFDGSIELGVLDGSTDPTEWIETVRGGDMLVLAVEGDINELAAGFARQIREDGGNLVHFRGFLIIVPEGIQIDNERLQ